MLVIRAADGGEASAVHGFIFGDGDRPNLRTRTLADVESLVERRVLFVGVADGSYATACFLDDSGDRDVEMGGAYTAPDHRGKGYGTTLAVAAIVHFYAMNTRTFRLISHVVTGNSAPRGILHRLGFKVAEVDGAYSPDAVPGIAHMDPGPDGLIHADLYEFEVRRLRAVVDEALSLLEREDVEIDLVTFADEGEMLREFRTTL